MFTYIFLDGSSTFNMFFKVLIIFWFSSSLERLWGSVSFGAFLGLSIFTKSTVAVLSSLAVSGFPFEKLLNGFDSLLSPNSLTLSLMLAYGFIHGNEMIYLFFILPVRVKILALISAILALVQVFMIFTFKNNVLVNTLIALTYISGYTALFVFAKKIFNINKAKAFFKEKINAGKVDEINQMLSSMIREAREKGGLEKSSVSTANISTEGVLCDPEDFVAEDDYCKSCASYSRCCERAKETN